MSARRNPTETINYPNGENETIVTNLDGTKASDIGTATTPALYDEGVVEPGGTIVDDDNGSIVGVPDAAISDGSTWTSTTADGTSNTTRTFANMLGEAYLTQTSASDQSYPPPMADAVTSFDGNGRPIKFVDVDGTTTYTTYDPTTGQAAMSFVDVNNNGVYDPGIDIRSTSKPSALPGSSTTSGSTTNTTLSNKGVQTSVSTTTLGSGVTQSSNTNGLATTTTTSDPTGPGDYTVTTSNPDGTSVVDTYVDGLLATEQVLGNNETVTTTTSYAYDGLRRMISSTDYTGTTNYTYFEDGTEATVQTPGHNAVAVNAIDQTNNAATSTTRSDGGTINTPQNSLGEDA